MLAAGHPIVGDATYTGDSVTPRMMLHAWTLKVPFAPKLNKPALEVASPDPFTPEMLLPGRLEAAQY